MAHSRLWIPYCSMSFLKVFCLPMFLIIGIWGGERRIYASYKFFIYTLLGSVLMLLALLTLYTQTGTTDIPTLMNKPGICGIAEMAVACAVCQFLRFKLPMWAPCIHGYLMHTSRRQRAGSVILAGVLLKMGGYGFFTLFIADDAGCFAVLCAFCDDAERNSDYLRLAGSSSAGRYEKAGGLFFCGAYGVCGRWGYSHLLLRALRELCSRCFLTA